MSDYCERCLPGLHPALLRLSAKRQQRHAAGNLYYLARGSGQAFRVSAQGPIASADRVGAYADGVWFLDRNGSGTFDAGDGGPTVFGFPGALPAPGDWNGDGRDDVGLYNRGVWFRDVNGNNLWDEPDQAGIVLFGVAGMLPVVGLW